MILHVNITIIGKKIIVNYASLILIIEFKPRHLLCHNLTVALQFEIIIVCNVNDYYITFLYFYIYHIFFQFDSYILWIQYMYIHTYGHTIKSHTYTWFAKSSWMPDLNIFITVNLVTKMIYDVSLLP